MGAVFYIFHILSGNMLSQSEEDAETHIRRLNPRRDLFTVADLIGQAFKLKGDEEGQAVLRQMRNFARQQQSSLRIVQLPNAPDGFVWEENGKIVGNISLINTSSPLKPRMLIANVAVDADYQHRGIATALTSHALRFILRNPETEIWLQVRSDNEPAILLYQKLGFKFVHAINQWKHAPAPSYLFHHERNLDPLFQVTDRRIRDWPNQLRWLNINYPQNTRWYQNVNFAAFSPWAWINPACWPAMIYLQHSSLWYKNQLAGVLTWQQTEGGNDQLWLALPQSSDEDVVAETLLTEVIDQFKPSRQFQLEFPSGHAETGIRNAGFVLSRSLDWMRYGEIRGKQTKI